MTLTVLTVCTGNICRSPAVETLLRAALDPSVTIVSAGTSAVVGAGISPPMGVLLTADGLDSAAFVARQLTPEMIRGADLVLALTVAHRAWIVDREPAAVRRTLTLRELARLSGTLAPGAAPTPNVWQLSSLLRCSSVHGTPGAATTTTSSTPTDAPSARIASPTSRSGPPSRPS